MSDKSCDHIGILTRDTERLVRFYGETLQFDVVRDEVVESDLMDSIFEVPGDCRLVKLAPRNPSIRAVNIEIFCYVNTPVGERQPRASGYNHWGLRVDDRERFVEELRKLGLPVTEVFRGGHSIYFISDPDGNRIEIRD